MKEEPSPASTKPRIGVVGPCKSGKSTLVRGLQKAGYQATQIVQEHSFAPRMWEQISKPEVLIYLHSDWETTVARGLNWMRAEYEDQQPRLSHARKNANLEIVTDALPPETVLKNVLDFLGKIR
jgi:deoxyadenosine/deoxycytidine kinase